MTALPILMSSAGFCSHFVHPHGGKEVPVCFPFARFVWETINSHKQDDVSVRYPLFATVTQRDARGVVGVGGGLKNMFLQQRFKGLTFWCVKYKLVFYLINE